MSPSSYRASGSSTNASTPLSVVVTPVSSTATTLSGLSSVRYRAHPKSTAAPPATARRASAVSAPTSRHQAARRHAGLRAGAGERVPQRRDDARRLRLRHLRPRRQVDPAPAQLLRHPVTLVALRVHGHGVHR